VLNQDNGETVKIKSFFQMEEFNQPHRRSPAALSRIPNGRSLDRFPWGEHAPEALAALERLGAA